MLYLKHQHTVHEQSRWNYAAVTCPVARGQAIMLYPKHHHIVHE